MFLSSYKFQDFYIRLICSLALLLLGPLVGFEFLTLGASISFNPFSSRLLGFTVACFCFTCALPLKPTNRGLLILWNASFLGLVINHAVDYFTATSSESSDESSMFGNIYLISVCIYVPFVLIPVTGFCLKRLPAFSREVSVESQSEADDNQTNARV